MRFVSPLTLALSLLLSACGESSSSDPSGAKGSGSAGETGDAACQDDAECDDGSFCTGDEVCDPSHENAEANGCVSGELIVCQGAEVCSEAAQGCSPPCDQDGDGSESLDCGGDDCDDSDPNRYPGNPEVCINKATGETDPFTVVHDEDCNPATLGDDADEDGFYPSECGNLQEDGSTLFGQDCDDANDLRRPGLVEVCDGLDNDCLGGLDFPGEDLDGDGFATCEDLKGLPQYDCDENSASVFPGAPELCDGFDNDCDGQADDLDEDGFAAVDDDCEGGPFPRTDCDDSRDDVFPMAEELCDGRDNDCNTLLDAPGEDDDLDGFAACGSVTELDCDPTRADVYPGAPELCDGRDNDCDTVKDDDDGDGFASIGDMCIDDTLPKTDCNDGRALSLPGGVELCNGYDDDCSGVADDNGSEASCPQDIANGSPACLLGACAAVCLGNYGNCDDNLASGCNTDLATSQNHCGACDSYCSLGCADSLCFAEWVDQFGGGGDIDSGSGLGVDAEGNAYVTGRTNANLGPTRVGGADAYVRKYLPNGTIDWTIMFGSSSYDYPRAADVDAEGNVFIVGVSGAELESGYGGTGRFVVKVSPSGVVLWTKQFPEDVQGVAAVGDGAVYVVGNDGDDAFFRHYGSASGTPGTKQTFGTAEIDQGLGIDIDASGNIYLTGATRAALTGSNAGVFDVYVRKLNAALVEQWVRQFGTSSSEYGQDVQVDAAGNVYVAGETSGALDGANGGFTDAFIRKYNSAGVEQWTRQAGGSRPDLGYSVTVAPSGEVYLAVQDQTELGNNDTQGAVYKYSANGVLGWSRVFGLDDTRPTVIRAGGSGVYLVGGSTADIEAPGSHQGSSDDAFIAKLRP